MFSGVPTVPLFVFSANQIIRHQGNLCKMGIYVRKPTRCLSGFQLPTIFGGGGGGGGGGFPLGVLGGFFFKIQLLKNKNFFLKLF